jgi:hypothetical protein
VAGGCVAQLNVVGVSGAGEAHPVRGAGLVDADSLGEDRRGEPGGEREQRSVASVEAALDPVALEPLTQPLAADVRSGMATGQQPPFRRLCG